MSPVRGVRGQGLGQIRIQFGIDRKQGCFVELPDQCGQAQSIQVTATSGLTQDEIKNMMTNAQDYLVERRVDEHFEGAKQEAETLIAEIERLFPGIERGVGSADFGRDAIAKAGKTGRRKRAAAHPAAAWSSVAGAVDAALPPSPSENSTRGHVQRHHAQTL